MSIRRVSLLFAVALTLILSSFSLNAQQPRAVPPNDSFMHAQPIVIGKSYVVPDIGAATNEPGEPFSLSSDEPIPNSVWFTFTQPFDYHVAVSTFGSVMFMSGTDSSMHTALAVYELTGPATFTEVKCNEFMYGVGAAQLEFEAERYTTYYIVAGTHEDAPFLPESTLKLSTRMLFTWFSPLNFEFEEPISDSGWKVKNADDDQIVCSDPTYQAMSGECLFRFIGTPGLTTTLTQTMPFPQDFAPRKNAVLGVVILFRVRDSALGSTKIKMTIRYSDGTPPSIHLVDLIGTLPNYHPVDIHDYYYQSPFHIALKSSKVASIKLAIKFGSPTGTLLLDFVEYNYGASIARGSSLLPVPPASN